MSARRHSSHRGVRAPHTLRPCRMRRRLKGPHSSGRDQGVEVALDLHRVGLQRSGPADGSARPTWVSTGRPGRPMATLRTTLAVLRPTPGRLVRSSIDDGTSPPKRSVTPWAIPTRFLAFERKKPVDRIRSSRSSMDAWASASESGTPRTNPASPCSPARRCTGPRGSSPPGVGTAPRAGAHTAPRQCPDTPRPGAPPPHAPGRARSGVVPPPHSTELTGSAPGRRARSGGPGSLRPCIPSR